MYWFHGETCEEVFFFTTLVGGAYCFFFFFRPEDERAAKVSRFFIAYNIWNRILRDVREDYE